MPFVCINCGHVVKELYKEYSSSVLKIKICEKCNKVADKYIECEPIIILIDLVLLAQPAYRHVLYNTDFRILWKLIVVIMLLESFLLWKDKSLIETYKLQTEEHFYLCFGFILIEKLILLALFRIWTQILYFGNMIKRKSNERQLFMEIIKSITLASIAKFLLLPIMIWNNNTNEMEILIHLALVTGYYGLCLINVYSVLVNVSRKHAAIGILLIIMMKMMIYDNSTLYIKDHFLNIKVSS